MGPGSVAPNATEGAGSRCRGINDQVADTTTGGPEHLWEEATRVSRWQIKGQQQTPRIPGWNLHQTLDAASMWRTSRSYEQQTRGVEEFYSKPAQENDGPRPAPPHKSTRAAVPVWMWTKQKPARANNMH